jgi:mannosyltransferase OCH1-like enzyme
MYMHRFGGVYADLDLIPLSSLSQHLPVLNSTVPAPMRIAWVGRMSDEKFEHSIPNAWMASTSPGHPFWLRPLAFVRDNIFKRKYNRAPEGLTGPVALKTCVDTWQEDVDIRNGLGEYDEVRVIENAKVSPFFLRLLIGG